MIVTDVDTEANALLTALTLGLTFDVPVIDLTDPIYQYPGDETAPLYQVVTRLANTDLTTGVIGGDGTFDKLMDAFKVHLRDEYDSNRITGAEYTKAYIALTTAAMQNAVQFLMLREEMFWKGIGTQMQAINDRANIEITRVKLSSELFDANLKKVAYAKGKIDLATTEANYAIADFNLNNILPAQEDQLIAGTAKINSDITRNTAEISFLEARELNVEEETLLIPKKGELLDEQIESQRAETMDTRTDGITTIAGSIGKQKDLYSQQITSYQRDAEVKAGKLFTDAWTVQKTIDEGILPPDGFTNASLDEVLDLIKTNNGFVPVLP